MPLAPCPSHEVLCYYLEGTLDASKGSLFEVEQIQQHLSECERCQKKLQELKEESSIGGTHPSDYDLEYYFQVLQTNAQHLLTEIISTKLHVEQCKSCQKKLKTMRSFREDNDTAIQSICPNLEDLEYYLQIKNSGLQSVQEESKVLRQHVLICDICQKRLYQLEASLQQGTQTIVQSIQCPPLERLKYYFRVRHLTNEAVIQDIREIKKHLLDCTYCQQAVQSLEKEDSPEEPVFSEMIAGCQLLYRIGGGAIGEVYKGLKISLGRLVAIKILRANQMGGALGTPERFQREAMTLAQLDHPNITQIYDCYVSKDQSNYYLIMQYVDGEDLEHYIKRHGPLNMANLFPFWFQILDGMNALHQAGIIHRDVKPSNILVDRKEKVKITDFGLAKSQEQDMNLTIENVILGTPRYMSPEACKGLPQSIPSDIYSLGCVFYFLLFGEPPFHGKNLPEFIYQHVYKDPPKVSERIPSFPKRLEAILEKMLAKNPAQRYSSCVQILRDLMDYLETSEQTHLLPSFATYRNHFLHLEETQKETGKSKNRETTKTIPISPIEEYSKTTKRIVPSSEQENTLTKRILASETPESQKGTDRLPPNLFEKLGLKEVAFDEGKLNLAISSENSENIFKNSPVTKRLQNRPKSGLGDLPAIPQVFSPRLSSPGRLPTGSTSLSSRAKIGSLPIENISLPPLKNQTTKIVRETEKSGVLHLEVCKQCSLTKPSSQFFNCGYCRRQICIRHKTILQICDLCLQENFLLNTFFKTIYEKLTSNQEQYLHWERKEGSFTFSAFANILQFLNSETHQEGLLVLGNSQKKKSIYFTSEEIRFLGFKYPLDLLSLTDFFLKKNLVSSARMEEISAELNRYTLLQELLLSRNWVSEKKLFQVLGEFCIQELLALFLWENNIYKFKAGHLPDSLSETTFAEFSLSLVDLLSFKQFLVEIFRLLSFVFIPGIFQISSASGVLSLAVSNKQIYLGQTESKKNSFPQYLVSQKVLTLEQYRAFSPKQRISEICQQLPKIVSCSPEQIHQWLKEWLSQEIQEHLQDPNYTCKFTEQLPSNFLERFIEINWTTDFFQIFTKLPSLPHLFTSAEIFTMIFEKNSAIEMVEVLRTKLKQILLETPETPLLSSFEKKLFFFTLVKANYLNFSKSLQQHMAILDEAQFTQISNLFSECFNHLFAT